MEKNSKHLGKCCSCVIQCNLLNAIQPMYIVPKECLYFAGIFAGYFLQELFEALQYDKKISVALKCLTPPIGRMMFLSCVSAQSLLPSSVFLQIFLNRKLQEQLSYTLIMFHYLVLRWSLWSIIMLILIWTRKWLWILPITYWFKGQ